MRRSIVLLASLALLVLGVTPVPAAAATTSLDLHADHVAYYSNRFVVTGDGNVRLRLSDGTLVHGESFAMDLKLNRFLVAGNVTVDRGTTHLAGAAYARFVDFDRTYFVPIGTEPDRWTYIGNDLEHPLKGRQMPGDAFAFPDTNGQREFIRARSAFVIPGEDVQFTPAEVATGFTYTPFPGYNLNFSPNPNFRQNAFAGAYIDVPVPLVGTKNTLTAVHARYDGANKLYASIDQHFVWGHDWAVVSLNPITRPEKQYNFLGVKRFSPAIELRDFTQFSNFQHGFSEPLASAHYTDSQLTFGLRRSYIRLNADFYNTELIGPPHYLQQAQHPFNGALSWVGSETIVRGTPLRYRLQAGLGYAHDAYDLGTFGGVPYTSVYSKLVQLQLYTPSQKVANNLYVSATHVHQRQWFSLPHYFDTQSTGMSLSLLPPLAKLAYVLSYNVTNVGDYAGAAQTSNYAPTVAISPDTGVSYPDFAAFRGFATSRSLVASIVYTPNPNFALNLSARKNKDFPVPVPGYYGVSPNQVTADVRFRLLPQLLVDVQRSYQFNWGLNRWGILQVQFAP